MKLAVKLTPDESEAKRSMIVELLGERAELDEEKKAAAKRFREEFKLLEKRIEGLRSEVAEGYEMREVEVDEVVKGGMVSIIRTDTREEVSKRRMTSSEKAARSAAPGDVLDDDDADLGGDPESAPDPHQAPRRARRGVEVGTTPEDPDPWELVDTAAGESE
jgi:hypothetical protein